MVTNWKWQSQDSSTALSNHPGPSCERAVSPVTLRVMEWSATLSPTHLLIVAQLCLLQGNLPHFPTPGLHRPFSLNFYQVIHSFVWLCDYCALTECVYMLSYSGHAWLFATLWTVAGQGLLSTEFSRQEYWSGLPYPPPGDLPDPGMEPASPISAAWVGCLYITGTTWEAPALNSLSSKSTRTLLISLTIIFPVNRSGTKESTS